MKISIKKVDTRLRGKIEYCAIFFLILLFFNCKTNSYDKAEKENGFLKLAYNNDKLNVDLGVGLWAWPIPIDYDEDGDMDLLVSSQGKPSNGTYFFENKSGVNNTPVFEKPIVIGKGVKNVQVSYIDGEPRVLGAGLEYKNFKDKLYDEPVVLFDNKSMEKRFKKIRFSQWKYVDYDNDGDLDLIAGIDDWGDYGWDDAYDSEGNWTNGPLHGYVYLIENIDGVYHEKGKLMAAGKPIDVYGAPTPNMNDFDGDGDLDLICGEFLDRLTWFENIGTRENPVFSEGRFLQNENGIIKMDLEMIIPTAVDWNKDGDVDLIVGDEDGRVAYIENTGKTINGMPVFNDPFYFQQKSEHVKFGALITPYSVDWDDDGDEDLICGNSAGYIAFIENIGGGKNPKWAEPKKLSTTNGSEIRYLAGSNGSIQGPAEEKWGYTTLSVNDWDGDGLKDIIVNSIWGTIEWHKNVGVKGSPKLLPAQPVIIDWSLNDNVVLKPKWNWWNPKATELVTQWRTTPVTIDWNNDGLMDLVVLDHEGYLAYFERFMSSDNVLKLKPGKRIFNETREILDENNTVKQSLEPLRLTDKINGGSGRRKWTFVDWDQDGDLDIIANNRPCAEWYENVNNHSGAIEFVYRGNISEEVLAGHTTSPTIVDWDKNGEPDLLLGAEDGFLYYLKNNSKQN